MPATADSLILGYSASTLKWLNANEGEIWKFFVKNKLLYETDPLVYSKYINDAPSTSGMPPEAPGNIGSWVGYRVVSMYMEKYKDVTLMQLMHANDAQSILSESKYKP